LLFVIEGRFDVACVMASEVPKRMLGHRSDVLKLYRAFLRVGKEKNCVDLVKTEFRRQVGRSRYDKRRMRVILNCCDSFRMRMRKRERESKNEIDSGNENEIEFEIEERDGK
jgi:hypothetical protein